MNETKTYFAEFAGVQFAEHSSNDENYAVFRNVRNILNDEYLPSILIPLTESIVNLFTLIHIGDSVIFRFYYKYNKPILECIYLLPYWYKSVDTSQWDTILNELQTKKAPTNNG